MQGRSSCSEHVQLLSGNALISPFWDSFANEELLVESFFFHSLNILTFLVSKVSDSKLTDNRIEYPLYVVSNSFFSAFRIILVSLAFVHLIIIWLGVDLFDFILLRSW